MIPPGWWGKGPKPKLIFKQGGDTRYDNGLIQHIAVVDSIIVDPSFYMPLEYLASCQRWFITNGVTPPKSDLK